MGEQGRAFEHAIDDAAAAAAAEDHRVRALEHLDPIDVVEVAEILNVVAQSVDEEVCRAVVAAQGNLVAVALAGAGRRAGYEHQQIGDRAQLLVLDLPFRNDGQRLRDVEDIGVGLGRGDGSLGAIFLTLALDDDLPLNGSGGIGGGSIDSGGGVNSGRIGGEHGRSAAQQGCGKRQLKQAVHEFPLRRCPRGLVLLIVIRNSSELL